MGLSMLQDIVILFALAITVIFICQKLNIPSVVGFLFTGVVSGPHGLGLVYSAHNVEELAELGIILLMFTIGIEFSFAKLLEIRKSVFWGGALQVALTSLLVMLIFRYAGIPAGQSLFIGFLIALSSTAIVLKILQDQLAMDTPHGQNILGILIFQDIIIIPMMLLTPVLAGSAEGPGQSPLILLLEILFLMVMVLVSARWIVPFLFSQIARLKSRELFMISTVTMCLAVALFTSSMGLSISLGAFLAGLIISESEYSHQALGNIIPFRDVFTSIFFISIGMLLDMTTFLANPLTVISLTLAVILVKTLIAAIVVLSMGFPLRTAVLAGLALGQVGEFSFILSKVGIEYQLLSAHYYQVFIAVSVLTMVLAPLLIKKGPQVAEWCQKIPMPQKIKNGVNLGNAPQDNLLSGHLIIIGYGLNGKNLSRAAAASGIPYMIIEMNPDLVREAKNSGEPIFYGDAVQPEILRHACLDQSRVVVVAISDPAATLRITDLVHKMNPAAHIIVRTRYIQEIEPLYQAGANEVIPEEFETSIEIFAMVLKNYMVPRVDIENFISEIRSDAYQMLRSFSRKSATLQEIKLHFHDAEIVTLRVTPCSPLAGHTLKETDLRRKYQISVLLIQRGQDTLINPGGDDSLLVDDQLVVLGSPERINSTAYLFCTPD